MTDVHRPLAPVPQGTRRERNGDDNACQQSKKRINIGVACTACKTRKLKCSGAPPCQNCLKNHVECTVDNTSDKRRKSGVKRKLETLEDRKDLLLSLVRTLRDSADRRVLHLLDLIRSDASQAEIRFYLDEELPRGVPARKKVTSKSLEWELRNGNGAQSESESPATRTVFEPEQLADVPLFDVPAAPWTNITQDARFVSQLVSLWFTWFHPFFNWLDRDWFIRDMRSGDLRVRCCSPFLVNAMLALACTHSNSAQAYAVPGDTASRGARFYSEAKRLFAEEEGRITLATTQALGLLSVYASLACKDRSGWIYRNNFAFAVDELSKQHPLSRPTAHHWVIDRTIWGLFNNATLKALIYRKVPTIKTPNRPLPSPVCSAEDVWHPYPLQLKELQAHTSCVFNALCGLNRIMHDLAWILFGGGNPPQADLEAKMGGFYARLRDWEDRLPICLREPEETQVPHLLCFHMYYYCICITLSQHAPSMKPDPDNTSLSPFPNPNTSSHHDTSSLFYARKISALMRIHRSAWGTDRIPVPNILWLTTALLTLLPNLSNPQNREAFINLAVSAKAFARRWVVGKAKLELVQRRAREMGVEWPVEIGALFADEEEVQVGARDGVTSASSSGSGSGRKRAKVES